MKLQLSILILFLSTNWLWAQEPTTVFRATFDYETQPEVLTDAASLNGGIDQIGSFRGELPEGAGNPKPALIGFIETLELEPEPMILIDRPVADGSFFADFASPIELDGASVSFDIGLRRSSGDSHAKDYSVIGRDADGNESFHLQMSAFSGETELEDAERVGFVSDGGATVTFDLPTVDGDDVNGDLMQMGKPPYDPGLLGEIELSLGTDGYSLSFLSGFNDYTTDTLSYNGSATTVSQIEFTFFGHPEENPLRSGFVLDDLVVSGTLAEVSLTGDCDEDGSLTIADANCVGADGLDGLLMALGVVQGDLDGNGVVEVDDFLRLSRSFGSEATYTEGDINLSGSVDVSDFLILSRNFGSGSVAAAVPEPSSACMLALGAFCLGLLRRRN